MDVVANMLPSKSKDFVGAPASVVENKRLDGGAQSLKRKALDLEDLDKDDHALLEEESAESLKRKALEEEEASTKFTESRACKSPPLSARSQELQQVVYQQERHWEAGADPPQLDQSQHLEDLVHASNAAGQSQERGAIGRSVTYSRINEAVLSRREESNCKDGSEDGLAWTRALEGEISMTNASPKSGNQALCCSKSSPTYIQEFESRSSADEVGREILSCYDLVQKLGCGAVNNPP
ncbi:hypothetical protein SELMODRAFT_420619 [Selaginella moellendorffii]|uniref:Uncharacterized protein n=1 Tax=Selaginella moellendorffii TaxID=88036 RepID=D8SCK4_SELML|nr:hypothetical protein SELMODRAFT_420619 [Selaginella moellendorffii]